jgi:hypothetical protein
LVATAKVSYAEDGNVQFAVEGGDPLVIGDDADNYNVSVGARLNW